MKKRKQKQVSLWMPETLYLKVKKLAKDTGVSLKWILVKGAESQVGDGQ